MPSPVDPEDDRVADDLRAAGRTAVESDASVLERPWPGTGHAWFASRLHGGQRPVRAYPHLLADDRAGLF